MLAPGSAPKAALSRALARLALQLGLPEPQNMAGALEALRTRRPSEALLLVVDQFEEIVSRTSDPRSREEFVRELVALSAEPAFRMVVILAIRADALDACGRIGLGPHGARFDRILFSKDHHVFLELMDADQLLEAIEGPAQRLGLEVEEGLAQRLREAAGSEPAGLALLQMTLDQLWLRRRGRGLLVDSLGLAAEEPDVLGSVLRARADGLIRELQFLSPRYLAHARRLLLQLVELGSDGGADRRKRVWIDEVRPPSAGAQGFFDKVVTRLIQERLVIRGEDPSAPGPGLSGAWLELAQEAVLQKWDVLGTWIDEARQSLVELRKLEARQAEWQARAGDADGGDAFLLHGAPLEAALELRRQAWTELPPGLERFVDRSERREADERASEDERQRKRVAAIEAARQEVERRETEISSRQAAEEDARREAARQIDDANSRQRAEADAREMAERDAHRQRRGELVLAIALVLVVGAAAAALWVARGALQDEQEARDALRMAAFHKFLDPDPTLALLFLREVVQPDRALGWGQAGVDVLRRPLSWSILRGRGADVMAAAFSPDGTHVLTASADGAARLWRTDGAGEPQVFEGPGGAISSVAFSPDGRRVLAAFADGTARVWRIDAAGAPVVLAGHGAAIHAAGFSPDGTRVLTASGDGTARLWQADGRGEPVVLAGHQGPVQSAAFSPDGSRVVTASDDGTVRVWRSDGVGEPIALPGFEGGARSAAFDPEGERVVAAAWQAVVWVWKPGSPDAPVRLDAPSGALTAASFSPDGTLVLAGSEDGTARVWHADGSGQPWVLSGFGGKIDAAAFSPDGAQVVVSSEDGTARILEHDRQCRANRPSRPRRRGSRCVLQRGRPSGGDGVGGRDGQGLERGSTERRANRAPRTHGHDPRGRVQPGRDERGNRLGRRNGPDLAEGRQRRAGRAAGA